MPYLLIRHKVKDYAKWKPIFDEHGASRRQSGSRGGFLFRNASDPNELVILLEWDDLNKARQFAESEDLKKAMERAGVAEKPDLYFLEKLEQPSV
jgi:heme-degrading monooxygenase HmoA